MVDAQIERSVISAAISDPKIMYEAVLSLKPEYLSDGNARTTWEYIQPIVRGGGTVDWLDMSSSEKLMYLEDPITKKDLIEGVDYSSKLESIVQDGKAYELYSVLIDQTVDINGANLQQKLSNIQEAISKAYVGDDDSDNVDNLLTLWGDLHNQFSENGKLAVFGIKSIDSVVGGIAPGWVCTVVSAPGVGKSALAIQSFLESMKLGVSSVLISTEMSREENLARMIARESGVDTTSCITGRFSGPDDERKAKETAAKIVELLKSTKSRIYDKYININDIVWTCKLCKMKLGTKYFIIDHMHEIQHDKSASEYERLTYIANEIKVLAKNEKLAIMLLGQVSVSSKSMKDSDNIDAKGTGAVKEKATMFVRLRRNTLDPQDKEYMTFSLIKNRFGSTMEQPVKISLRTGNLTETAYRVPEPEEHLDRYRNTFNGM